MQAAGASGRPGAARGERVLCPRGDLGGREGDVGIGVPGTSWRLVERDLRTSLGTGRQTAVARVQVEEGRCL